MADTGKEVDKASEAVEEVSKPGDVITAAAVTRALRADKGDQAELKSFRVVDFTAKGDNYASYVTSVEVDYCLEARTVKNVTYVVKCIAEGSWETICDTSSFIFKKETTFYENIFPVLNKAIKTLALPSLNLPKCFYTCDEPGKKVMFLEDMRKKTFTMFDRTKGLDKHHAILVLRELARLHAAGFLLENEDGEDTVLNKYFFEEDGYRDLPNLEDMYASLKSTLITMPEIVADIGNCKGAAEAMKNMAPKIYSLMAETLKPMERFSSICHGDCWTNNFLFRYENEKPVEVCLVDLQMHRFASIATDLQCFFYTSFDGDVRKNNLEEFISTYYSELEKCLKVAGKKLQFSQHELRGEYQAKSMYGLAMGLVSIPQVLAGSSDAVELDELVEGQDQRVRRMMSSNPRARSRLMDLVADKVEDGVLA